VSPAGHALPLRGIALTAEALGGIARTRLRQHFSNAHPDPLELTYTFALPADGAVSGYEIRAGSRIIAGRVERRTEAREQYEAARLEGRTAALVEQERPNVFTQSLGNIPALTDVHVELTIDQPLGWIPRFGWEWRFPTVVAPRYLGAEGAVPDAERVTVDVVNGATSPTAALLLTIGDDSPAAPTSPTHGIHVGDRTVTLASGAALDRDIVVRWPMPGQTPGGTLRTARSSGGGTASDAVYGLLTIVPPVETREALRRDLVLLLDVSGSMQGQPLDHLKSIVTTLIDTLGDNDRLEMVAFSSGQVRYQSRPVSTTAAERSRACAWIRALSAGGGTEMIRAIAEALRPLHLDAARQVVVVTDGLIGFETAAVRAIRDGLPQGSRLHAVGVGSASNRAFLRSASRAGRGVEILVDLDEPAAQGAERIVAATRQPVVSDVVLEGSALQGRAPRLQDLLMGSPVVAPVRLRPDGGTLVVRGRTAHGPWEQRIDVHDAPPGPLAEAIPALWAREAIEDLELELACGGDRADVDRRIEELALRHSVSSRLTSWVAISQQPDVDPRQPVRVERIPQALPYGTSAEGVGLVTPSALVMAPRIALGGAPFAARLEVEPLLGRGAVETAELRRARQMAARHADLSRRRAELENSIAGLERDLGKMERERAERLATMARMRAEHDERIAGLDAERRRLEQEIRSQAEALERLQAEAAVTRPVASPPLALKGRVVSIPGRPTTTIEATVESALDWRPAATATAGGRTVSIVPTGTTRPGPIAAGSLLRVELSAAADEIRSADRIEIACGDKAVIVTLVSAP
jgi:Ca-activated chloride channel family protein